MVVFFNNDEYRVTTDKRTYRAVRGQLNIRQALKCHNRSEEQLVNIVSCETVGAGYIISRPPPLVPCS